MVFLPGMLDDDLIPASLEIAAHQPPLGEALGRGHSVPSQALRRRSGLSGMLMPTNDKGFPHSRVKGSLP